MSAPQPFPLGTAVQNGNCDGVYCFMHPVEVLVASAKVGPSWRNAVSMDLCANCLADFAAAGTVITQAHTYVLGLDGLYHEVKGTLTTELDGVAEP
jgi:hypothetical protein